MTIFSLALTVLIGILSFVLFFHVSNFLLDYFGKRSLKIFKLDSNNKIDNFDKENIKSIDLPDLPELENFSKEENIFLKLINDLNELINNNCVNITTKYYEDLARSMGCEWTYVLDLDYEKFSIKSIGDELCISNIPLDIKKLEGLINFYES